MSTSLECRLLCAYDSLFPHHRRPHHPQQPYFDAAQFLDDPVGFVGGNETINACLVRHDRRRRRGRLSRVPTVVPFAKPEQIAKDHRGACGGGYMGAVCPQGVCP
jgi:hypothetical protein